VPSKGKKEWEDAIKAMNAGDFATARKFLEAAVATNPKFALAWHNLGIMMNNEGKITEARDAFAKAVEADPKMLRAYVPLVRSQLKLMDWAGAIKSAAAAIPLDKARIFPELYVHQAVAHYNLKDLAAAEASLPEAFSSKNKRGYPRAEYVLGRILEAKGDAAGAKQHMQTYLEKDAKALDADVIKTHIAQMGQASAPEPDLEILVP
jgi:tetratricopeptide (TPR) repeat protein